MITLSTIVYEGNFEKVLSEDCWFFKYESKLITEKLIIVNNLTSTDNFNERVKELSKKHKFRIHYVEQEKDFVLKLFDLDINESTLGYNYTIPYFVLASNLTTPYVLHVASDCMDDIKVEPLFLINGMDELIGNPYCLSVMVSWVKNNKIMPNQVTVGRHEAIETMRILEKKYIETEHFVYRANFTDQFFLTKTDNLKMVDYKINPSEAERIYHGPDYGGHSFEKRIVGHQVKNNIYNGVYKGNDYYIHDGHYY